MVGHYTCGDGRERKRLACAVMKMGSASRGYEIAIAESKTAARGKIGLDKRYLL
jgi:hypothetical protein